MCYYILWYGLSIPTVNQSSEDPFANKLPGEHGESPDEDLE